MRSLSREAFKTENEKISSQAADYSRKIAELEAQIRKRETESGQENAFVERFSRQAGINELSREVMDEFIQSVHVYAPDRIEIILNYADEFEKIQEQMGFITDSVCEFTEKIKKYFQD